MSRERREGRAREAFEEVRAAHWSSTALLGGKVPSRVVVDVTAGYRLPKQRITITGTLANAFDNRTPDVLGAPIPGRLMWLSSRTTSTGCATEAPGSPRALEGRKR